MESDEKDYDCVSRSIENANRELDSFDKEFKEYLSVRKNGDDLEKRVGQHFKLCQTNAKQVIMNKTNTQMNNIVVRESIDDFQQS